MCCFTLLASPAHSVWRLMALARNRSLGRSKNGKYSIHLFKGERDRRLLPSGLRGSAALWVAVHQVWTFALYARGRLTWVVPRLSFITLQPKWVARVLSVTWLSLQANLPCLFRQCMMLCHNIMPLSVNHSSCLCAVWFRPQLLQTCGCGTMYMGIFSGPRIHHKLCFSFESVPFTGEWYWNMTPYPSSSQITRANPALPLERRAWALVC